MKLDGLIFPAPPPTYTYEKFSENLFFVPKCFVPPTTTTNFAILAPANNGIAHIPCFFTSWHGGSSKVFLYFHGNAEDLGKAEEFLSCLSEGLKAHVVAMEYPGYGIYPGTSGEERICEEALNVYDYIHNILKWDEKDIIVFGRSIGSGPATHVASKRNPAALVLMSAFTCIKDVVKHNVCMFSFMIADRLRNIDKIPSVVCPKIFIHGLQDDLVPAISSERLYDAAKEPKKLAFSLEMTHNVFDMWYDLVEPLQKFMDEMGISVKPNFSKDHFIVEDTELPSEYTDPHEHWSCSL